MIYNNRRKDIEHDTRTNTNSTTMNNLQPTYNNSKTCKWPHCSNPVEDQIRAWGKIIEPVNCKTHRKLKNEIRMREQNYNNNFGRMLREEREAHDKLGHTEGLNPGGYCKRQGCSYGRDWS